MEIAKLTLFITALFMQKKHITRLINQNLNHHQSSAEKRFGIMTDKQAIDVVTLDFSVLVFAALSAALLLIK